MFEDETHYANQYSGKLDTLIDEFYKENTDDFWFRTLEAPEETYNKAEWLISHLLNEVQNKLIRLGQEDLHTLFEHTYMAKLYIFMVISNFDTLAATNMGRTKWQGESSHESEYGEFHVLRLENALDTIPSRIQDITMTQKLKNASHHLLKFLQVLLDTYLIISKDNKKKIAEEDTDTSTRAQEDKNEEKEEYSEDVPSVDLGIEDNLHQHSSAKTSVNNTGAHKNGDIHKKTSEGAANIVPFEMDESMSGSKLVGFQNQAPNPPEVEQPKVGDLVLPSKEPEQDKTGDMTLPVTTETDDKEKKEHREVPSIPSPTMEENFENAEPLSTSSPRKNIDVESHPKQILDTENAISEEPENEDSENSSNDSKLPSKLANSEKISPESDDSEPDKSDSDSSSSSDQPSSDSEWESFPDKKKESGIKPQPEEITIDDDEDDNVNDKPDSNKYHNAFQTFLSKSKKEKNKSEIKEDPMVSAPGAGRQIFPFSQLYVYQDRYKMTSMNSELSQAQEQPRPTFLLIMINNRLTSVTYLKENNARYSLSHLLPHYNILSHNARVQYDICDQIGKEILSDHVPPAVPTSSIASLHSSNILQGLSARQLQPQLLPPLLTTIFSSAGISETITRSKRMTTAVLLLILSLSHTKALSPTFSPKQEHNNSLVTNNYSEMSWMTPKCGPYPKHVPSTKQRDR